MKKRIFIAGHKGMAGSALVRHLEKDEHAKHFELVLRSRAELDLLDQAKVADFFSTESIDEVYLAAGKVGGDSCK